MTVELPLTKGFVTLVDDDDYPLLSLRRWHVHRSGGQGRNQGAPYARGYINNRKVYLHRHLCPAPPEMDVDHINGNTLDNRRENLQVIDPFDNLLKRRRHAQSLQSAGSPQGIEPGGAA